MLHEMRIMDGSGDTKVTWEVEKQETVSLAEKLFNAKVGAGFNAYRMFPGGQPGEQIVDFDPNAGRIVLVPPLAGG